jgi:hypothetical protein
MATFIRRHPGPGIYQAAFKEKADGTLEHITLENRDFFETDDKKMIEFLRNDPEIEEVDKKTLIESQNDETGEGKE